jgi:DNA-binding SARP family transcriptional activator
MDGRTAGLGGPRQRSVLAFLLLNPGQVVPVDRIIDALWEDAAPRAAKSTLRGYVSHLRRALADPAPVLAGPLITRPSGYQLDIEPGQIDAVRFERLLAEGRRLLRDDRAADAARVLREALALWRGPALADLATEPWARAHCTSLEEQRQAAIEARIQADLALGRHVELVSELETLAAEYPLREELAAHRMLALYRSGRQAEALDAYRMTYKLLAGERGIEPSTVLRDLEGAILRHDPGLDWIPPARPMPTAVPAELPADVLTFTGRAGPLADLDGLLYGNESPAPAVVISAIAGAAGIGKSALAVHWGHRVRDRFPDGQLHVNLRGFAPGPPMQPIEVLARFLRALGMPAEQVPIDLEEAAGRYRSLLADRRVLVILDNASSAEQVRPLLPASPGCLVVVTSRDRLAGLVARDGAISLTLDVLTHTEALTLLARIVGDARVRDEPEAAAELVRLCACLPLAVNIAAANLVCDAHRGIADCVAELRSSDRLAALEVRGDEQSAVRSAFDLSYLRLTAQPQRLFRLLGLAPGPDITPEAAASLAGTTPDRAASLLDTLADAHLVDQHAPGRYTMHDLLRLYAAGHARDEDSEAEREAATERLYDWYLCRTDAAAQLLYPQLLRLPMPARETRGFTDHTQGLAWLDAERSNLVAITSHAATHGPRHIACGLADALRGYFFARRFTVDWLTIAEAGLAAAQADGDPRAEAAAHLNAGNVHSGLGEYLLAIGHYQHMQALTRQTAWLEGQASAFINLGLAYWRLGRLQEAVDHYLQALTINRRIARVDGQAVNLDNLGDVYRHLGQLEEAAQCHTQALELFRQRGSRIGEAINVANVGEVCHELGRLDDAIDLLTRALLLHREVGDRASEADTLRRLAAVHRDRTDLPRALDLACAALSLATDAEERGYEAAALNTLATIHHRLGRQQLAIDGHQQALDLARETGNRYAETEALIGMAAALRLLDQLDQACRCADRAVRISRQTGYRVLEGHGLTVLATIDLLQNETSRAVKNARQALAIQLDTGHRLGQARALLVLGRCSQQDEGNGAAQSYVEQAHALLADIGIHDA